MSTENFKPERITKPIQLLAAWLLGLILINSTFLTAASQISKPEWAPGLLIIATVVNIPLFLGGLFLLQTKFRPEMQEDTYYSKYLERKYNKANLSKENQNSIESEEKETEGFAELITKELGKTPQKDKKEKVESILRERDKQRIERRIVESRGFSQLYIYPEKWSLFVERWRNDPSFIRDVEELIFYKVVDGDIKNPSSLKLTLLGQDIAKKLFEENKLWNQVHDKSS